jgi:hypothetical protein
VDLLMLKALPLKMASHGKKAKSPEMCFLIKRLHPMPRVTHAPRGEEAPEPDRVEVMGDLLLARR